MNYRQWDKRADSVQFSLGDSPAFDAQALHAETGLYLPQFPLSDDLEAFRDDLESSPL